MGRPIESGLYESCVRDSATGNYRTAALISK